MILVSYSLQYLDEHLLLLDRWEIVCDKCTVVDIHQRMGSMNNFVHCGCWYFSSASCCIWKAFPMQQKNETMIGLNGGDGPLIDRVRRLRRPTTRKKERD